jgi:hypothetical protein
MNVLSSSVMARLSVCASGLRTCYLDGARAFMQARRCGTPPEIRPTDRLPFAISEWV